MNITVNVDGVTLSTVVGNVIGYDEDGDPVTKGERTIADMVTEKIVAVLVKDDRWKSLKDEVQKIRAEMVREALRPLVAEAIAAPVQKTNTWGEPSGEPVTMRELILEETRKLVREPADSYHRDQGTVIQKMVRDEVRAALLKDIKDTVLRARSQVADEAGRLVSEAVQSAMKAK